MYFNTWFVACYWCFFLFFNHLLPLYHCKLHHCGTKHYLILSYNLIAYDFLQFFVMLWHLKVSVICLHKVYCGFSTLEAERSSTTAYRPRWSVLSLWVFSHIACIGWSDPIVTDFFFFWPTRSYYTSTEIRKRYKFKIYPAKAASVKSFYVVYHYFSNRHISTSPQAVNVT